MRLFSKKNKTQESPAHLSVSLPYPVIVKGTVYSQTTLKKMLKDGITSVSTTPLNSHQLNKGWPEDGSININVCDSRETTEDNWIGYIQSKDVERLGIPPYARLKATIRKPNKKQNLGYISDSFDLLVQ